MHTADVVLIGGGIVGSSIAYHLVAAGCKNVLVIERETAQGKGSTGKSMGGVRAQFSTPVNIQMSLYSIPFYASFEERLGYPCDYRPQGYLFCATNEKHMAYLRANYEKQVAMGLKNVRLVAGDEIRGMFPQLRGDDIVGGSFLLHRRFRRSLQRDDRLHDLGERSRRHALEERHRHWNYANHGSFEVATTRDTVSTRTVVNCAGAMGGADCEDGGYRSAGRTFAAYAGSDGTVRPISAHRAHDHRYVERLSLSSGEARIPAGVE